MNTKKILASVFVLMLVFITHLTAQTSLEVSNALILIELDPDSEQEPPADDSPTTMANILFRVSVIALFSDTALVDSVHIKIGRVLGGSDVANLVLPFNGLNLPSEVCLFLKEEEGFTACVSSSESNAYHLYLEIWADDKQGNATPVFTSSIN